MSFIQVPFQNIGQRQNQFKIRFKGLTKNNNPNTFFFPKDKQVLLGLGLGSSSQIIKGLIIF